MDGIARTESRSDPALEAYLFASGETEADEHLEKLLVRVEPVVRGVIRRRWPSAGSARDGQVVEDLYSEALYQILSRLHEERACRHAPGAADSASHASGRGAVGAPIRDLEAFSAIVASRTCDASLRRRYPERARLKRRLEYLVSGQGPIQEFALWAGADGARVCGLNHWRGQQEAATISPRYRRLVHEPRTVLDALFPGQSFGEVHPADLLGALFEWVGSPLVLEDLVRAIAEWAQLADAPDSSLDPDLPPESRAPGAPGPFEIVAQRQYLSLLWSEIRQLPCHQAAALLLNLKDSTGYGLIGLLPIQQIAGVSEIAQAMGMPPLRLAELWGSLPIDDLAVAELLGCSRQQVINYRRSARDRLSRRVPPDPVPTSAARSS